jgi:hypothetical protein
MLPGIAPAISTDDGRVNAGLLYRHRVEFKKSQGIWFHRQAGESGCTETGGKTSPGKAPPRAL